MHIHASSTPENKPTREDIWEMCGCLQSLEETCLQLRDALQRESSNAGHGVGVGGGRQG